MQTPPPTPTSLVLPGAPPRRLLCMKRSKKTTPGLSPEDKAVLMFQLTALRAKHAARVS